MDISVPYKQPHTITQVVSTTSGSGSETITGVVGFVDLISYVHDSYLGTANVSITNDTTGEVILSITGIGTSDLTWRPRAVLHLNSDGSALSNHELIYINGEDVTISVTASAGTTSGTFILRII